MIRNDERIRLDIVTEVNVTSSLVMDVPPVGLQESNEFLGSQMDPP
jgi:hypothetical protein